MLTQKDRERIERLAWQHSEAGKAFSKALTEAEGIPMVQKNRAEREDAT